MGQKIFYNEYELGNGAGCWAKSREDVPLGTVRMIKGVLMSAWHISPKRWRPNEIWWTPIDKDVCYSREKQAAWLASYGE